MPETPPTRPPVPTGWKVWVVGARPRTLPAAVLPVAVGTAVAHLGGCVVWWRAAAALLVSLALQVGVNYANDYSDGVRGTDDVRVGPLRLVASGAASAGAVRAAAFVAFGVAAVAGLALTIVTSPWLLAVGAAAIVAAWFYTGGPRPYGYAGLGELFVFVFFGLVAVVGTVYVQLERITATAWWASVPVGLLITAMLVVNNLRDIPGDREVGKRTLAVRLGDARTRWLYLVLVLAPFPLLIGVAWSARQVDAMVALAAAWFAREPVLAVRRGALGRDLIPVLGATGRLQLAFGILLTAGLVI